MSVHLWKALAHLYPSATPLVDYELRDDGAGPYIATWNIEGAQPTAQQIADAIVAYDAARDAEQTAATTLRNQVRTLANSAAGKAITDLTAGEVRALLAILLHKAGAITSNGTVRPLGEWV